MASGPNTRGPANPAHHVIHILYPHDKGRSIQSWCMMATLFTDHHVIQHIVNLRSSVKLSVGGTSPSDILEIEGLFTQGLQPGQIDNESVDGTFEMDSADWRWSNGVRYHVFDTRSDTEFNLCCVNDAAALRVDQTWNERTPHLRAAAALHRAIWYPARSCARVGSGETL